MASDKRFYALGTEGFRDETGNHYIRLCFLYAQIGCQPRCNKSGFANLGLSVWVCRCLHIAYSWNSAEGRASGQTQNRLDPEVKSSLHRTSAWVKNARVWNLEICCEISRISSEIWEYTLRDHEISREISRDHETSREISRVLAISPFARPLRT